jgi:hypothetical protein
MVLLFRISIGAGAWLAGRIRKDDMKRGTGLRISVA